MTFYIADRITDKPAIQLTYPDPLMVVSIHATSLERYVFIRTITPLRSESINALYEKEATRIWTAKLFTVGFKRVRNEN